MAPHRLNSYLIISLAIITTLSITACSTKKMTKQEEYKKKQEDLAKKRKENQEKKQKDYAKKKKDERERQKELAAQAVYSWKGYEDEREKLVSALVNAEEDDARSRERDTPKPVRLSKKTAAIQPGQNVSYNAGENSSSDSGGCMSSFWSGVDTANEVMPYVQQGVDLAQQYDQLQRSRRASYSSSSSSSSGNSSSKSSSSNKQTDNNSTKPRGCCDEIKNMNITLQNLCRDEKQKGKISSELAGSVKDAATRSQWQAADKDYQNARNLTKNYRDKMLQHAQNCEQCKNGCVVPYCHY